MAIARGTQSPVSPRKPAAALPPSWYCHGKAVRAVMSPVDMSLLSVELFGCAGCTSSRTVPPPPTPNYPTRRNLCKFLFTFSGLALPRRANRTGTIDNMT